MGMNVNPKDFSAKVDSTRVVIPAGQKIESDSVWSKSLNLMLHLKNLKQNSEK